MIREKALEAYQARRKEEEAQRIADEEWQCNVAISALSRMLGIPREEIAVERPDIPWLRVDDVVLSPAWHGGRRAEIHGFYLVANGEVTDWYVADWASLGEAIARSEEAAAHRAQEPEPGLCPIREAPCLGVKCAWGLAGGHCAILEIGLR